MMIKNSDVSHFENGEIEINGVRYIPESVLMSGSMSAPPKDTDKRKDNVGDDVKRYEIMREAEMVSTAGDIIANYIGGAGNQRPYNHEIMALVRDASEFLSQKFKEYTSQ